VTSITLCDTQSCDVGQKSVNISSSKQAAKSARDQPSDGNYVKEFLYPHIFHFITFPLRFYHLLLFYHIAAEITVIDDVIYYVRYARNI